MWALTLYVAIIVHTDGAREEGIVSKAAAQKLHDTTELDYMTHIVLRMYENKRCAASANVSPNYQGGRAGLLPLHVGACLC